METQLFIACVLQVAFFSGLVPAVLSHSEFVHAGELINRENMRTVLG